MKLVWLCCVILILATSVCFQLEMSEASNEDHIRIQYKDLNKVDSQIYMMEFQRNFIEQQAQPKDKQAKTFSSYKQFDSFLERSKKTTGPNSTRTHRFNSQYNSYNTVKGVDEPDLLKTDGTYLYSISNFQIFTIALAFPASQFQILSTTQLGDKYFHGLIVQGNYVCLIGQTGENKVQARIYDVADKRKPVLVQTYVYHGDAICFRKINEYLYIHTNNHFGAWPEIDIGQRKFKMPLQQVFYHQDGQTTAKIITALNLKNPLEGQKFLSFYVFPHNDVFITRNNIYLLGWNEQTQTIFKRISINGTSMIPSGSGRFRGGYDRYPYFSSADERGNFFRLFGFYTDEQGTKKLCVATYDYSLQLLGFLDLNQTTLIYPIVRFLQNRVCVATYTLMEQTKLITISLDNHRTPKILGQILTVSYIFSMFEYDRQTIVAVEFDLVLLAEKMGIAFFDVSNTPKQIIRTAHRFQKYSTGDLQNKGILISKQKKMIVLPRSEFNIEETYCQGYAYVFNFEPSLDQITFVKQIKHQKDDYQIDTPMSTIDIGEFLYTKSNCKLKIFQINHKFNLYKEFDMPCKQIQPK